MSKRPMSENLGAENKWVLLPCQRKSNWLSEDQDRNPIRLPVGFKVNFKNNHLSPVMITKGGRGTTSLKSLYPV